MNNNTNLENSMVTFSDAEHEQAWGTSTIDDNYYNEDEDQEIGRRNWLAMDKKCRAYDQILKQQQMEDVSMKLTKRMELDKATIEITQEQEKVTIWVYNKVINEHVSMVLNYQELYELQRLLNMI